jgi:putative transposase
MAQQFHDRYSYDPLRKLPAVHEQCTRSQLTSEAFTGALEAADVKIGMDSKGCWLDNVFVERLWRSFKYKEVYLKAHETIPQAKVETDGYFKFYNAKRRHQGLIGKTLDEVYCP